MKRILALVCGAALALTGCGSKEREMYRDSPVGVRNEKPADVLTFPDGFSNVATKCDGHGNRVYVLFHYDSPYGGIAVVAADPSCAGQ